jgi:hypothetical protein
MAEVRFPASAMGFSFLLPHPEWIWDPKYNKNVAILMLVI